jgi:hypothetical protein
MKAASCLLGKWQVSRVDGWWINHIAVTLAKRKALPAVPCVKDVGPAISVDVSRHRRPLLKRQMEILGSFHRGSRGRPECQISSQTPVARSFNALLTRSRWIVRSGASRAVGPGLRWTKLVFHVKHRGFRGVGIATTDT